VPSNLSKEIDQAFANVEYNLKNAGGKGWSQVYKVVTYCTEIHQQQEDVVRNLKAWMPNHRAIWTTLGVKQLGADGMHFEIEVEAYDPEGAAISKDR
jgi:enamine deaminase RidA (YjgF/YER057c/UK114 family)